MRKRFPPLLAASLCLNALGIVTAAAYAVRRYTAPPPGAGEARYYARRVSLFERLRQTSRPKLVFAGDSLTNGCEWAELLSRSDAANRGIDADTTEGLLGRIHGITALRPSGLFLMIGVNDLARGIPVPSILRNYGAILAATRAEIPGATVYVQSILPASLVPAGAIIRLNRELRRLAEANGAKFIDLYPYFAGPDQRLKPEFTNDGTHLLAAGYEQWKSVLAAAGALGSD